MHEEREKLDFVACSLPTPRVVKEHAGMGGGGGRCATQVCGMTSKQPVHRMNVQTGTQARMVVSRHPCRSLHRQACFKVCVRASDRESQRGEAFISTFLSALAMGPDHCNNCQKPLPRCLLCHLLPPCAIERRPDTAGLLLLGPALRSVKAKGCETQGLWGGGGGPANPHA